MRSFACSSTSLVAVLSPETRITFLSLSTEQFTGYSAQELVGRPITWILADSSAFQLPRILDTAKEWGYWDGQMEHRARDGSLLKAQSTVSLLANDGNEAAGYLLVSSPSLSAVLDAGERSAIAEISTNLRAVAHDLNNPLAVLMGYTQLIGSNENHGSGLREDIERLNTELRRVIQIVGKLHEYAISLSENSKPEPVSRAATTNSPGSPGPSLWD